MRNLLRYTPSSCNRKRLVVRSENYPFRGMRLARRLALPMMCHGSAIGRAKLLLSRAPGEAVFSVESTVHCLPTPETSLLPRQHPAGCSYDLFDGHGIHTTKIQRAFPEKAWAAFHMMPEDDMTISDRTG